MAKSSIPAPRELRGAGTPRDVGVQQEVQDKIEYAKSLHAGALERMSEWEKLYKGEYDTPKDIADASLHAYKPMRPRAIVHKMLALLSLRAKMKNQVVPKKDTQEEEAICTRLERYLDGYQWRIQSEKNEAVFRHAVQWGLLRGKTALIAQYVPRFVDSEYFPIRSIAPDPMTVFEVPGENGVMYFVRESKRYAMELKKELDKKVAFDEKKRWSTPVKIADRKPTDEIVVVEYWDGEYYSVLIDNEMVLPPTEHEYGFCPLAVAYLEDTPFTEMEWRGQSVLAPVMDAIKNDAILMAKLGDAVSSFFWPIGVWQTPDGRAGWVNPSATGIGAIPPDAKLTFFNPAPNIGIIESYKRWLQDEISINSLPEIAWATSPAASGAHSGFAITQVLGQVMDRIEDKKTNLEFAFGMHFGHVLRLTAKFADRAKGGKFEVMMMPGHGVAVPQRDAVPQRGTRHAVSLLGVGADEVAEHYQVLTKITPSLPTEKMAMIQQMAALRAPQPKTGLPLVDDKSLREMFPEIFEHPDVINLRVDEGRWEQEIPEIHEWEKEEYLEQWKKEHPPHVNRQMNPEKLTKEELVQRQQLIQMFLENPQAAMQALARMGQGQTPTPAPPPSMTGEGSMLPPEMLAPQMQSGNPNPLQGGTPEGLAAQQMGRGMRPPR